LPEALQGLSAGKRKERAERLSSKALSTLAMAGE